MTFKELLQQTYWKDISLSLQKTFDSDEETLKYYKEHYFKLLSMTPSVKEEPLTIGVRTVVEEDETWYDIYGEINHKTYALDFTPWEEWLGYNVDVTPLSNAAFVAHCFEEMTFYGSEEDTKELAEELSKRAEKISNGKFLTHRKDCVFCDGSGQKDHEECFFCKGSGKMTVATPIKD